MDVWKLIEQIFESLKLFDLRKATVAVEDALYLRPFRGLESVAWQHSKRMMDSSHRKPAVRRLDIIGWSQKLDLPSWIFLFFRIIGGQDSLFE